MTSETVKNAYGNYVQQQNVYSKILTNNFFKKFKKANISEHSTLKTIFQNDYST